MNATTTVKIQIEVLDHDTDTPVFLEGDQIDAVLDEAGVVYAGEPRATEFDGTYVVEVDEAWFSTLVNGVEWKSSVTWQGLVVVAGPNKL